MSQYGAYGYAKHGKGYRFILGHYYTGTTIGTLDGAAGRPRPARHLQRRRRLQRRHQRLRQGARPGPQLRGPPGRRRGQAAQLRRQAAGQLRRASCAPPATGRIAIAGIGTYRGALEVVPTESDAGSLNAINALPVDQYVKGVIPNESPPSWPAGGAAGAGGRGRAPSRSPATSAATASTSTTTPAARSTRGWRARPRRTNAAAEATRGQVVMYGGKIAETYFSACSGGHTESVQNVFFGPPIPYLVGVPDPYDYYCPLHNWTLEVQRPGNQRQARRLPRRAAEAGRDHQARRLAADRLGEARSAPAASTKVRGDQLAGRRSAATTAG